MNAEARVSLDASGFEAGAQKVKNADREMAASAKENFEKVGSAAAAGFAQVSNGAERASRSYKELREQAQMTGRALEETAKRAAAPWSNGPDESAGYQKWLRRADDAERAVRANAAVRRTLTPVPSEPEPKKVRDDSYMRAQELSHVGRSVVDTVMAGQSPLRALEMEGPRLVQAFGGGLGTILGVGTAVAAMGAFVSKTYEAVQAAKELGREFHVALRAGPLSGSESAGGAKARVGELDEIIHKNAPPVGLYDKGSQKVKDTLADFWKFTRETKAKDFFDIDASSKREHDTDSGKDRRNLVRQAEAQRAEKLREIVGVQRESNDLQERAARHGEDSVRADQVRLETRHKIAALEEEMGLPKLRADYSQARNPAERASINRELRDKEGSFMGQKVEIERTSNQQIAADDRRQAATRRAIDLENELVGIKVKGSNVEVQAAEARRNAAYKNLQAGPDSGDEYAANAAKLKSADAEVRSARLATNERREELGIRAAVSALTQKADAAHLLALNLEEQKLKSRLASSSYGPDAKAGFAADLRDNQAAQRAAIEANIQKGNQGWLSGRAATYGRGYDGQEQSIKDRQMVNGMALDANTAGTRDDGSRVFKDGNLGNQQLAQATQLRREMEDLQETREKELGSAKEVVKETDLQARGMHQSATDAATIYSLTELIRAANFDNNKELALTKQAQLDIIQNEIKLRNFIHPEGPAAERAGAREQGMVQRAYDKNAGLLRPTINGAGEVTGGTDPATGQYRPTTAAERARSKSARNASLYDGSTKAVDATGHHDLSFDERFHKKKTDPKNSVAEQNRPNAPEKPKPPEQSPMETSIAKIATTIEKLEAKFAVF